MFAFPCHRRCSASVLSPACVRHSCAEASVPFPCVTCSSPSVLLPVFLQRRAVFELPGMGFPPVLHRTAPSFGPAIVHPSASATGVARGHSRRSLASSRPRSPPCPGTSSPLAAAASLSLSTASFRDSTFSQNCQKAAQGFKHPHDLNSPAVV